MNRHQTLLQVAASFEDDFTVSVGPDLPELFEGPDVLAGRAGRLIAVFVPKRREMTSPEWLRTRLILSRLALPDHAQCVLALQDGLDEASPVFDLAPDFHAVVHVADRAGLRRWRSKPVEQRRIPPATRDMVGRRMAFLLALGRPYESRVTLQPVPGWSSPALSEPELPRVPAAEVHVRDGVLIGGANGQHLPVREQILPYLTVATRTAFQVDNGVPYLNRPTVGVLVLHDAAQGRADPLKPLRASAFAGWALLTDPSQERLSERVRAVSEWLAGSISDRP